MLGCIEIPLCDSDEVVELYPDQLPDSDEVIGILRREHAQLHIWINLALEYYKQQKIEDFIKILKSSRIYANVDYQSKRDIAKNYFRIVTESVPDNVEAWIELAQMQENDWNASLNAHKTAKKILKEKVGAEVRPEILNNVGSIHHRLGNLEEARKNYEESLLCSKIYAQDNPIYYNPLSVTTTYNLARVYEELYRFDRAEKLYKDILKEHPDYIDCYLRLGCMARDKGQIYEASGWFKDALQIDNEHRGKIFAQVLEATTEFCDVWLNIAHIYVEQKQFVMAIRMYKNCLRKFYKYHHVEVLQYLARAYFKAGKFKEAKMTLLKACRVAPQDTELLYNVALVLERLAEQILKDEKSTLTTVLQAVHELELSHKYFQYLATLGDSMKQLAEPEVRECQDLLLQAQYHVARARRLDEEEKMLRRKLEDEKQAFKLRQAEEQQKLEELRRQKEKEILQKRQEYIQKTKNIRVFGDMPTEKTPGKKGRRPRTDQYVSDCDGLGGEERREDAAPREKKKRKISSEGLSRGKGKKRNEERSGSESDRRRAKRARKLDSGKNGRKLAPEVTRNNSRFLSKETISTSESESDKDVNNKQVVMR
ncbi:hypothetical protein PV325_008017 [Microctonus aethiopoides]|nr:hypothetical protein PV325_008017 [Microctonus aethiopoides]